MAVLENNFSWSSDGKTPLSYLRKLTNSALCEAAKDLEVLPLVHGEDRPTATVFCLWEEYGRVKLRVRALVELGDQTTGGWPEGIWRNYKQELLTQLGRLLGEPQPKKMRTEVMLDCNDGLSRVLSSTAPTLGSEQSRFVLHLQTLSPMLGIKKEAKLVFKKWLDLAANPFMDRIRAYGHEDYMAQLVEWRKYATLRDYPIKVNFGEHTHPEDPREGEGQMVKVSFSGISEKTAQIMLLMSCMGVGKGSAHGMGGCAFSVSTL